MLSIEAIEQVYRTAVIAGGVFIRTVEIGRRILGIEIRSLVGSRQKAATKVVFSGASQSSGR